MSSINCAECGQDFSASATACPQCGHPVHGDPLPGTDPIGLQRNVLQTPAAAAAASSGHSTGSRSSRLPTWLVFVLVFVVGSAVLVAGIAATVIVVGSIVDGFDALNTGDESAAATTTVTAIPAGGEDGLQIGQCIDDGELDKYLAGDDYSLVSCDDPHDTEVYYRHEFEAGPYPGDETVTDDLKFLCRAEFEGYVGTDFDASALSFWALWPTKGAWEAGNRLGECALFDLDSNKLTGSAYQSGW